MSLKVFHIVFITLATLMTLGCGLGAFRAYQMEPTGIMLAVSLSAFAAAALLVAYGFWFLKKARHLIT